VEKFEAQNFVFHSPGPRWKQVDARIFGQFYFVHWILATNGVGYQLITWGPPGANSDLKGEAEHLFSSFEITSHR